MSETDRLELEALDEEISLHEFLVASASSHPRYRDSAMLYKNPVANLQIPNKLFQFWSAKRSLQDILCTTSVTKHYELTNQNICGSTLEAVDALEVRLRKEASRLKNKCKTLRREEKNTFEKGKTNMLVYQNEINLPVPTSSTHVAPVAEKKNDGRLHFNGKCMHVQFNVW